MGLKPVASEDQTTIVYQARSVFARWPLPTPHMLVACEEYVKVGHLA